MAIFILLFGLEIFEFLLSTSKAIYLYPQFYLVYHYPSAFLYGPIFFLHIRSLDQTNFHLRWKHILHLLPTLFVVIVLKDVFLLSGLERIQYTHDYFISDIMPYNYAKAFHMLSYGIASIFSLKQGWGGLPARDRLYALIISIIYFLATLLVAWLTEYASGWRQFEYYYLLINCIFILIGYLLYSDADFLKKIEQKYLGVKLSDRRIEEITTKLRQLMDKEKVYLDSTLSLKKLANAIAENPHHLSQTLSLSLETNFNGYVNDSRIRHAKIMLEEARFDHFKIEAIALESGFTNKATFHKAFVKNTAVTPAVYRSRRSEMTKKE